MKKSRITTHPILIMITAVLVLAVSAAADESKTMTGKIVKKAALDQHQPAKMGPCPAQKTEIDFVFLADDGIYYDLPNVTNHFEAGDNGIPVAVTGKVESRTNSIRVDKITKDGRIIWCERKIIHYDNPLYPADIPDLCS